MLCQIIITFVSQKILYMVQKHEKYVNPYTDFGFKKLFGTELNKDLLISLLNALFDRSAQQSPDEPKQVVKDLRYLPTEKLESYGATVSVVQYSMSIARVRTEKSSLSRCRRPARTSLTQL